MVVVTVGCFLLLPPLTAKTHKTSMKDSPCFKTWHIQRHSNPWNGLTGDAAAEEATFTVRAVKQRPAAPNMLAQPGGIAANDFFLYRSEKDRAVVVNARYFGDLTRQDVTGRPLRKGGVIGVATPAALKRWQPAELLGLLLEQQIILTYAHIEATVCLVDASETDGVYRAELTGEHVYYTNERNVSGLDFRFEINLRTGTVAVQPKSKQ